MGEGHLSPFFHLGNLPFMVGESCHDGLQKEWGTVWKWVTGGDRWVKDDVCLSFIRNDHIVKAKAGR